MNPTETRKFEQAYAQFQRFLVLQNPRRRELLWKLMQHVLPRGFRRVRDYGFLHPNAKRQLQRVQLILRVKIEPKNTEKKAILCQVCKKAVAVVLINPKIIPMMFHDVVAQHPIATASPS
jgi:hypothetical protein